MAEGAGEIARNNLKEKLARDELAASMIVRLVRSPEIARIAKTAGFDSLYVDLEHGSFSPEVAAAICLAALDAGIAPLVRVPGTGAEQVSRALDGGALGVIAPHVGSAPQARDLVKAAKFPPLGERSSAGPAPQLHYRTFPATEANEALNAATMVVVQLETAAAIEQADAIADVAGIDMVLVGTNDLTADMGIAGQFEHARVREAYARTIEACRSRNKHVGIGGLASRPDLAEEFVKMGARYVSAGTDLAFLLSAASERAGRVHRMGAKK